jgi:hypothetical protein
LGIRYGVVGDTGIADFISQSELGVVFYTKPTSQEESRRTFLRVADDLLGTRERHIHGWAFLVRDFKTQFDSL